MSSAPIATNAVQQEVEPPNPSPLTHHLRSTMRLFQLVSAKTEIDHPLCAECTQTLRNSLQNQLDQVKKERDGYLAFEKEARKERDRQAAGLTQNEAEAKIEQLKVQERDAIRQLTDAERERIHLAEELKQLEEEEAILEAQETE